MPRAALHVHLLCATASGRSCTSGWRCNRFWANPASARATCSLAPLAAASARPQAVPACAG
eukprot:8895486-Lingulodinium_polyedra.AAC.1